MTFKSATLAGLLSAAIFATAMPASALTIDNFDCGTGDLSVQDTLHGGVGSQTGSSTGACIIGGGTRELVLSDVTGVSLSPNRSVIATVDGGVLDMQQSSLVNSTLTVNWSGFGIQDLTQGGINNGFSILVAFVDTLANLQMTVTDIFANSVSSSTVSNSPGGGVVLYFANFAGVDLTNVTALSLQITGPTSFDPTIDYVNAAAVPEPATFMLLGLGLLGIGAKRVFRKA